jgi:SAM-dependent methyltransferase
MSYQDNWKLYYEKTNEQPPRETLTRALDWFKRENKKGKAFDIGSGACNDVRYLLSEGWKVIAADNEPKAQVYFKEAFENNPTASFQLTSFENIKWEAVELIHAGFTLPFCPQEYFQQVIQNIKAAIKKEGRFAGNFFGSAHTWTDLVLLEANEIKELFRDFEIEYFEESKLNKKSLTDELVFHHNISIVAKKR